MQQTHPHLNTLHQAHPYKPWQLQLQQPSTNHRTCNNHPIEEKELLASTTSADLANTTTSTSVGEQKEKMIKNVVSENAVIVISKRGCCMSHVVKRLLLGLGVNPAIYEFVDDGDEKIVVDELQIMIDDKDGGGGSGDRVQFPAVFIGGRLFGGLDRIMTTHITGELTPILRQAGALWL